MAIEPGSRIGPYQVTALIGEGGMGEVYRARDTRLKRDVAVKILPESFASDPDRLARFQREAEVLASLNHPNIAAIHGLEESDGTRALVMELVEGETLADRIARGPIPVDEALPIARQIAEALEAAHEQGIIHRDLKPANIKLRPDGTVKVLDFGLAKLAESSSSNVGPNAQSISPTITSPAMMTGVGVLVGTAAYMSPEQARGRTVDKRTDIWAFGCVLFEMLTGRRAFEGDDISTTLAAVLKTEPQWAALPSAIPVSARRVLNRSLQKDPRERLRDVGEARIAIEHVLGGAAEESVPLATIRSVSRWRHVAIPAVTLLVGSLVTAAIISFAGGSTVAVPRLSRLTVTAPSTAALTINGLTRDVAVTPDGSRIIYVGANGTTLFVRPLDQLEAVPLVRGAALRDPFPSPDGQWVGFFDGPQTLKKVALTGGPPMLVTQLDGFEQGATWAADGTIIFATAATTTGLQRISADGGTPVVLTRPDRASGEIGHRWPELLPDGHAVLYTVMATTGGLDGASLAALDLRSVRPKILLRGGSHAQYMASGHLVYAAEGTLRAVGFDPSRLTVVGPSTPIVAQVLTTSGGAVEAGLARDGTLVYVSGSAGSGSARTLVWVDRQGRETLIAAPPHAYFYPRLSPDGMRVAMTVIDQKPDIWLWDLIRGTLTRVTSDLANHANPLWTPEGRRVVFSSDQAGAWNLFSKAADSTGAAERLTESPNLQWASAFSPDGTQVIFTELSPKTGADVMAMQLDRKHEVLPLVQTPFNERNGSVSPDGRWLAYEADDSGPFQIYVRPFPEVNSGHWQISTNGGIQPLWARSGHELFYVASDGALMRVAVAAGPAWTADAPTKVLEGGDVVSAASFPRNYDIAVDGQRFLMPKVGERNATGAAAQIVVVQHFDEELKRLVPTK